MATTEQIKALREETGLSVMQCQKALEAAGGDRAKAIEILKSQGADIALGKSGRTLGAGAVVAYIHSGETIGVMLELLSETDFVAKNPDFRATAREIAMHVAAMHPETVEVLLEQPFIKDPSKTINDIVNATVQKFGERTEIGKFVRFSLK